MSRFPPSASLSLPAFLARPLELSLSVSAATMDGQTRAGGNISSLSCPVFQSTVCLLLSSFGCRFIWSIVIVDEENNT